MNSMFMLLVAWNWKMKAKWPPMKLKGESQVASNDIITLLLPSPLRLSKVASFRKYYRQTLWHTRILKQLHINRRNVLTFMCVPGNDNKKMEGGFSQHHTTLNFAVLCHLFISRTVSVPKIKFTKWAIVVCQPTLKESRFNFWASWLILTKSDTEIMPLATTPTSC